MKKIRDFVRRLPMRWKMTAMILLILGSLLLSVSVAVTLYSTRYYTELQNRYSKNTMRQASLQLDGILSNIDTLYLTFNSQKLFTAETVSGSTFFQCVYNQIYFEKLVNDIINANNLQDLLIGTLFYLDEDCYYYVGGGTMAREPQFAQKQWFQDFARSGGKPMMAGPLTEDFKSAATQRYPCIYYIVPYGAVEAPGAQVPFILFTIKLDSLMREVEKCTAGSQSLIVMSGAGERIHSVGIADEDAEALLPALHENILSGSTSLAYFEDEKYICAYYQKGFDLWIVFVDETESVFAELAEMNRHINVMIAAFAIAGILLAAGLIKRVTMPLKTLNDFLDIMEQDPDAYIVADPHTETGRIGIRLNEMKQKNKAMGQEMNQLQLQEREAQVSALQSQINPHFIFNTLDNIYCIAQLGETEPIISLSEHLSQMMHYSLSMKQSIVPLRSELEHCRSYVIILNIRFGDKIRLRNEIDEALWELPVLKLSLQPIIENAWTHSLQRCEGGGDIFLRAFPRGDTVELVVENTGLPLSEERCREVNQSLESVHYGQGHFDPSHGIALENINNRLKLSFGEACGLQLYPREEGGCRVVMKLPRLRKK